MGNTASAPSLATNYIADLVDFHYEKSLSSTRFLKTILCSHAHCNYVVKVLPKQPSLNLEPFIKQLESERDLLFDCPNTLPHQRIIETERAGFLVRQYLNAPLYDRISTRPFLSSDEKKWIAFQMIKALDGVHANNIVHGDIKTENVLVTSWNWVYLTDFASFKPVYLPQDNPADFTFYFDTSARRTCYLAPERFCDPSDSLFSTEKRDVLLPSMDIFALGCTIAELFMEGNPLFTLAKLLRYKKGEFNPLVDLEKIDDVDVRDMIAHMIQLDPLKRMTAAEYLEEYRIKVFADAFSAELHPFMTQIARLHRISDSNQADRKIQFLYENKQLWNPESTAIHENDKFIVNLSLSTLICSQLRSCHFASSLVHALEMISTIGNQLDDESRMDRLIPFLVSISKTPHALVRANIVSCLTGLLENTESISVSNANVYSEYLFPLMGEFLRDTSPLVRARYAESIAVLDVFESSKAEMPVEPVDPLPYDQALSSYHETIQDHVVVLLMDAEVCVKRALLSDIPRLCIFFGRQKTNDVILSHLITYMNDPDPILRIAFVESLVGIGTFVGSLNFEEFILPLLQQATTDPDVRVVERVIKCLASVLELGLLTRNRTRETAANIIPLLCHPVQCIRAASIGFFAAVGRKLSPLDVQVFIYPLLRQFLKFDIPQVSKEQLLDRKIFDATLDFVSTYSGSGRRTTDLYEGELIARLKELGLTEQDKEKLYALKNFVYKTALSVRSYSMKKSKSMMFEIGAVVPHTVFLSIPKEYIEIMVKHKMQMPEKSVARDSGARGVSEPRGAFSMASRRSSVVSSRMSEVNKATTAVSKESGVGRDEFVREMLVRKAFEMFPRPVPGSTNCGLFLDFGPFVPKFDAGHGQRGKQDKYQGVLLSQFKEHKGAITSIKVSPDHLFFVSGSEDGTLRVWDTFRLERNPVNRSRLVITNQNGPIRALCFCQNSYSIISASENGAVHFNLVQLEASESGTVKYKGHVTWKVIQLDKKDFAVCLDHYETDTESVLVLVTFSGIIVARDIRSDQVLWEFKLPAHFGYPTAMCMGNLKTWILLGTSRGVFSLWDVRKSVQVKMWHHPQKQKITSLSCYPQEQDQGFSLRNNKTVLAGVESSTAELSLWDIEKAECLEVWCVLNDGNIKGRASSSSSVASLGEGDMHARFVELYGNGVKSTSNAMTTAFNEENRASFVKDTVGTWQVSVQASPNMMIAAAEKTIRCWDSENEANSFVFCEKRGAAVTAFSNHSHAQTKFHIAFVNSRGIGNVAGGHTKNVKDVHDRLVNLEHRTSVCALALLKYPYPLIVSGDREGCIKVWK